MNLIKALYLTLARTRTFKVVRQSLLFSSVIVIGVSTFFVSAGMAIDKYNTILVTLTLIGLTVVTGIITKAFRGACGSLPTSLVILLTSSSFIVSSMIMADGRSQPYAAFLFAGIGIVTGAIICVIDDMATYKSN